MDHLPSEGESISENNIEFTVVSVDKNRIDKVHIQILPEEEYEEDENAS